MSEISARVRLRPTRIGFLVSPTDFVAIRSIIRVCCCLWGGHLNPIIPVFKRPPSEWNSGSDFTPRGYEIAKGYIRYFEPDVYVEAKLGLLEKVGLGALRSDTNYRSRVVSLTEFFNPEQDREWSEPAFGLNVCDVFNDRYKTEQQFVRRDAAGAIYVEPSQTNLGTEAIFGAYPQNKHTNYIRQTYENTFKPLHAIASPETWRRVFLQGSETPLRATRHSFEYERRWHHNLVIFVFDPDRTPDIIDLWNLRLQPKPILPVPLPWFGELNRDLQAIITDEHRPLQGNPNGVMQSATIEFGRSIPRGKAEQLIEPLKADLPKGALVLKFWRDQIWKKNSGPSWRDGRLRATAEEKQVELVIKKEGEPYSTFENLSPKFAEAYSLARHRWVNALVVTSSPNDGYFATSLPFNTFEEGWPRLDVGRYHVSVGTEGWIFSQSYSYHRQWVSISSGHDFIREHLKRFGIDAIHSEPGRIAHQILEHIGGIWGLWLLADIDTLRLLNKMAGGLRRRGNGMEVVEEHFGRRTAPVKDWNDLISKRRARRLGTILSVDEFTKRRVIRLGLESDCPHCGARNWNSLTDVDYSVSCERCLKAYDFPQSIASRDNRKFSYRVVGPFAVPDYARGSYGALLSLRLLKAFGSNFSEMTYSTAMSMAFDGLQREVDFVAWVNEERHSGEPQAEPKLVIGEAKSFGAGELITAQDLTNLKSVVSKLPRAFVCISVMRDHFTTKERRLLSRFVSWANRLTMNGEAFNPVILLTSRELTVDFMLSETWRGLGGKYAEFANFDHTRDLVSFAQATQQIYLGPLLDGNDQSTEQTEGS